LATIGIRVDTAVRSQSERASIRARFSRQEQWLSWLRCLFFAVVVVVVTVVVMVVVMVVLL
jgi:t-SNARE complex subunit (syntaxin)